MGAKLQALPECLKSQENPRNIKEGASNGCRLFQPSYTKAQFLRTQYVKRNKQNCVKALHGLEVLREFF